MPQYLGVRNNSFYVLFCILIVFTYFSCSNTATDKSDNVSVSYYSCLDSFFLVNQKKKGVTSCEDLHELTRQVNVEAGGKYLVHTAVNGSTIPVMMKIPNKGVKSLGMPLPSRITMFLFSRDSMELTIGSLDTTLSYEDLSSFIDKGDFEFNTEGYYCQILMSKKLTEYQLSKCLYFVGNQYAQDLNGLVKRVGVDSLCRRLNRDLTFSSPFVNMRSEIDY